MEILHYKYEFVLGSKVFTIGETKKILEIVRKFSLDLRGIEALKITQNLKLQPHMQYSFNFYHQSINDAISVLRLLDDSFVFELEDSDMLIEYIERTYL